MKGLRFIWHMEITEKMLTTCSCTCFADLDGCVHKVRPLGTFFSLFLCGTKAPPVVFIGWNSVQHSCDKTSIGWVDVGTMWGELGPPFLCVEGHLVRVGVVLLGPPKAGALPSPLSGFLVISCPSPWACRNLQSFWALHRI